MSRPIYIDNFDPDLIPGFEIDQIRPDQIPEKIINTVQLALADGEKFISSNYVKKQLMIRAHFYAGTRALYETARDTLLGVLDSEVVSTIIFEQSGSDRRYKAVYENVIFDYKDNGTCIVTIEYRCVNPFGEKVAESTFYNQTHITDEVNQVIEVGGNIYALPKTTIKINDIDDDEAIRTLSMTVSQGSTSRNIQITRVFNINDTIIIDSKKHRVYVNGSQTEYSGRFPQLIKSNTFRFNIVDATDFDVDVLIKYNERYL